MQDITDTQINSIAAFAGNFPAAADPDRLRIGLEDWREATRAAPDLAAFADALEATPEGQMLLSGIFGNSPYLSGSLIAEPALLQRLMGEATPGAGAEAVLRWIYESLDEATPLEAERDAVMAALRIAKRRIALLTALCDLGGLWPLMRLTGVLSDFADRAVETCCRHLLRDGSEKGEITLPHPDDPTRDSGLIILGMGKLGARELNYSSDIDLVILYEAEKVIYTGRRSMGDFFVRFARNLVAMMQERTRDGYVFRTDLRLRPDPGATPLALSVAAAHVYYESQGQNWERAAMIKARPIAGDLAAGAEFSRFLIPFIWRKSMDFAAIEDIQAVKSQIHTFKGFSEISLEGHNIKIGRGGIREIEFFCQTQQLIEGGRNPHLRTPTTLAALRELHRAGKITADAQQELTAAYHYLRTLEHRLQMINDEQTQLLPEDAEGFRRLGIFFGFDDTEEFRASLRRTLETVNRHYDALFRFEGGQERKAGRLVFTGAEDDPDTLKTLTELGFGAPATVSQKVREWHHGRYRCTRTVRAQQTLTALMPTLLEALGETANPDIAFARFDMFLQKLPAGVQLFSLFKAYPSLLKLVAKIMGTAPDLADRLAQNPMQLDSVLEAGFLAPLPPADELQADLDLLLGTARDYQDILDYTRRWANDQKFRLGVHILENIDHGTGLGATVAAGPGFSDVAEVVLRDLFPRVRDELARTHGVVPGAEFAVIGLGKLGSRQMTPASDADLMFVFETPEQNMMTDGPKPIPAGLYFVRLSQRFINALSVHTGEGQLYEVDMRLRPHGKSGPIALPLTNFVDYYQTDAWTWEHLALTRARAVAGDAGLMERTAAAIRKINETPRDPEKLRTDTLEMRERVHKAFATDNPFSLKHAVGGMMDIEFLCQYLRLRHGPAHPAILLPNSMDSLQVMNAEGVLPAAEADRITEILGFYLNISGLQQICLGDKPIDETIPLALQNALAEAGKVDNFAALAKKLQAAETDIDALLGKYLGAS